MLVLANLLESLLTKRGLHLHDFLCPYAWNLSTAQYLICVHAAAPLEDSLKPHTRSKAAHTVEPLVDVFIVLVLEWHRLDLQVHGLRGELRAFEEATTHALEAILENFPCQPGVSVHEQWPLCLTEGILHEEVGSQLVGEHEMFPDCVRSILVGDNDKLEFDGARHLFFQSKRWRQNPNVFCFTGVLVHALHLKEVDGLTDIAHHIKEMHSCIVIGTARTGREIGRSKPARMLLDSHHGRGQGAANQAIAQGLEGIIVHVIWMHGHGKAKEDGQIGHLDGKSYKYQRRTRACASVTGRDTLQLAATCRRTTVAPEGVRGKTDIMLTMRVHAFADTCR